MTVLFPGVPPIPRTHLVGREPERGAIRSYLADDMVPLLTLIGPGGVGKTRLALAAAGDLADQAPGGVIWADLAPVADPGLVPTTVAAALALPETAGSSVTEAIIRALQPQHSLLLLDNGEHLLEAAAQLVATLLAQCPSLQVLATSRVLLGVSGEQAFPVSPLALPPAAPPGRDADLAVIGQAAAVRLFVARAQAVHPDFALSASNAGAVGAICRRLDGLPLAIELAAARSRHLPPPELAARLADRFSILVGGPRDQPPRLRTMHGAIAWSHDLLGPEEQVLFRRLAVFAGGFTLEAAQAVMSAHDAEPGSVFEHLGALMDQSLIRRLDRPTGEARFGMLETIREFAREHLVASGEERALRDAHAAYFLDIAERTDRELHVNLDAATRDLLTPADQDNLRAALAWLELSGQPERCLRLATSSARLWDLLGQYHDGLGILQRALAAGAAADPTVRMRALRRLGVHAGNGGHTALADAAAREGVALAEAIGDRSGMGWALIGLAISASRQGDLVREGHLIQEALACFRDDDNAAGMAHALGNLSDWAYMQQDYEQAAAWAEEVLALSASLPDPLYHAVARIGLGQLALERRDPREASTHYLEAAQVAIAISDIVGIAQALSGLAGVAVLRKEPEQAARWLGATQAQLRLIGAATIGYEEQHRRAIAVARAALSPTVFAAAWAGGEALSLPEAIAEAITGTERALANARDVHPPAANDACGLSARERDVLRHLVMGRSDQEIATALFLGTRTVQSHVSSILKKLRVSNRTEAAAFAVRQQIG